MANPVAETILEQLGGQRFIAMTGARNLVASDDSLTFKIMANSKKITHVRITLVPGDNYRVEFLRIRCGQVATLRAYSGIYVGMLISLFEEFTGLYTSL